MTQDYTLSEDDFEQLEELLTSEAVPADCMNLEMLDGYLAAVIACPRPLPLELWMPAVWSAENETASFGSASAMQRAMGLVMGYYNEILTTIDEEDEEICWEPFCYAPDPSSKDSPLLGEDWIAGFEQGLELWPEDWEEGLSEEVYGVAAQALETVLEPWEEGNDADDDTRLEWLLRAAEGARALFALWRELELEAPEPIAETAPAAAGAAAVGRNDPCPCGSGKKYKKCCGAVA